MTIRFTEEDLKAYESRRAAMVKIGRQNGLPVPKKSKYRNVKVIVDGVTFDSKREYNRWVQLQMMEKAGKIEDLQRQQTFILAPAVILDGRRKPPLKYICDHLYYENGELVCEDVKSPATRAEAAYRIKKHLMASVHQIEVREI